MSVEEAVDRNRQSRGVLRAAVTRIIKSVDEELAGEEPDVDSLRDKLEILINREAGLQTLNETINGQVKLKDLESEIERELEYSDSIIICKGKIQRFLNRRGSGTVNADGLIQHVHNTKLPRLVLDKFNGDIKKFYEFWPSFEAAVHDNSSLSKVEKFNYLKSLLIGEAARAISGLTLSNVNYDKAVQILKDRFGQEQVVISAYMNALLALRPVRRVNDTSGLRKLYDEINSCIRGLESSRIDIDSYGDLLYPVLNRCIPSELVLLYNRRQVANKVKKPVVSDLLEFLKDEVEARELSFSERSESPPPFAKSHDPPLKKTQFASCFGKGCSAAALNIAVEKHCDFCPGKMHRNEDCRLSVQDKYKSLYNQYKCNRCFCTGHKKQFCKARGIKCKICGSQAHWEYLCERNKRQNRISEVSGESKDVSVNSLFPELVADSAMQNKIYYQTARVNVVGLNKTIKGIRILIDSGSESSFLLESIAEEAELPTVSVEELKIHTFGSSTPPLRKLKRKKVLLKDPNSDSRLECTLLVIDTIVGADLIQAPSENVVSALRRDGFVLSDEGGEDRDIGILIGNDLINRVLTGKTHRLSACLMLYETIFGWVISGSSGGKGILNCILSLYTSVECSEEEKLSDLLQNWFQLESMGIRDSVSGNSESDDKIIRKFEENLRFENGRYVTRLLWREEPVELKDNFYLAKRQFDRLQKQLEKDAFIRHQFEEIIDFQRENNIVEESTDSDTGYFMPYRSVVRKDKSTTQVRLVFNCSSAKKGDLSLNDYLEQGPNLNPNLLDVLLKFRIFKVAFCGDIEKAFLMIGIDERDRRYLRFLWSTDDKNKGYVVMQMSRVLFGSRCSPFLLRATIRYHVRKYLDRYPDCVSMLDNALYADDLCYGAETVQKALSLSAEAVSILKEAGFNLRKLYTNSKELRALWIQRGLSEEVESERDCKLKVLGLVWDLEEDCCRVDVAPLLNSLQSLSNTKRSVLSTAAKVFDPVGFICPFVVRIKRLMQEIWERGVDWDVELPEDLRVKWEKWYSEVGCLSDVQVNRCYFSKFESGGSVDVHIFCDASQIAYGAVAYLRWEITSGEVGASFVMAKSRVAPLRKLSLPRLELMGTLVGARLWNYLSSVFGHLVKSVAMWTDSEICLHWIKGSAGEWKQFVSNRVVEIQECVAPDKWFHCPGVENPADRLTRGMSVTTLKSDDLWWNGPNWLKSPRDEWPEQKLGVPNENLQEKRVAVQVAIVKSDPVIDVSRFSTLTRLLRVTAYVLRFLGNLRRKGTWRGPLVAAEINEAETFWMKRVQQEHFYSELVCLKDGQQIPADSQSFSLAPYLEDGLLRVRGRLEQSDLSHEEKHPILLPKSRYTDLLILHEHNRAFHAGVTATLSRLRERVWIPRGRQSVKSVLKRCLVCRKYNARPARQQTGQLPKDRVIECPPFTTVGTDFTGAIHVKTASGVLQKVYIVLFTCAVTRAVHLEVVSDMSVKSFILSLRRFLARRGSVKAFYSDNAKTFRSSCEILKTFRTIIREPELKNFITSEGITWKFIPERSPWWGGFWERLMRSIKEPLRKTLGRALLTLEELTTILTEIESVINNRPITYDSDELGEPRALSPSHFLLPGDRNVGFVPEHFLDLFVSSSDRVTLNRRKLFQTRLLKQLWVKWKNQYLLQLKSAHNLANPLSYNNLKIGDIVLIEGTAKSKLLWDIGRMHEIITGRDGLVRAGIVKTAKGNLRRAVQLLYPLEV